MEKTRFPNCFIEKRGKYTSYYTKTDYPKNLFEERVKKERDGIYREVDPSRSKLFAGIARGISQIGIKEGSKVLYLGASHGYTPSFVSDMVGKDGFIFALDFAPRVVKDLVFVCDYRENMCALLEDANKPDDFEKKVAEVDVVYMDIAQKNQVEIFLKNCDRFLINGGFGILALKARSVDVTKKPNDIFKQVRAELEKHIIVVDYRTLDPYEKDHALFVVKKK